MSHNIILINREDVVNTYNDDCSQGIGISNHQSDIIKITYFILRTRYSGIRLTIQQ